MVPLEMSSSIKQGEREDDQQARLPFKNKAALAFQLILIII
jgi:hypothetical protein